MIVRGDTGVGVAMLLNIFLLLLLLLTWLRLMLELLGLASFRGEKSPSVESLTSLVLLTVVGV